MAFDPVSAGMDLVSNIIGKIWGDKMSEADRKKLELEAQLQVLQMAKDENSTFYQFVTEYEGAAKDVPKLVVVFRSLIRPAFTCLVGYLDWLYLAGVSVWPPDKVGLLKAVNIIVLMFWFGERAVTNSGIIDLLKSKLENK